MFENQILIINEFLPQVSLTEKNIKILYCQPNKED